MVCCRWFCIVLLFCAWDGAATIKIKLAVAAVSARNFDNRILLLPLLDTINIECGPHERSDMRVSLSSLRPGFRFAQSRLRLLIKRVQLLGYTFGSFPHFFNFTLRFTKDRLRRFDWASKNFAAAANAWSSDERLNAGR